MRKGRTHLTLQGQRDRGESGREMFGQYIHRPLWNESVPLLCSAVDVDAAVEALRVVM